MGHYPRVLGLIHLLFIPKPLMNIFSLASNTTRRTDLKNQPSALNGVRRSRGDAGWGC